MKKLNKKDYLHIYTSMLEIRRFEERAAQLFGMGHVGGFCHLYIGQEAVVVGMQSVCEPGDSVITSYRDHGHMLACGMDPKGVMAELTGREGGYSKGKGGSMHIADFSIGLGRFDPSGAWIGEAPGGVLDQGRRTFDTPMGRVNDQVVLGSPVPVEVVVSFDVGGPSLVHLLEYFPSLSRVEAVASDGHVDPVVLGGHDADVQDIGPVREERLTASAEDDQVPLLGQLYDHLLRERDENIFGEG